MARRKLTLTGRWITLWDRLPREIKVAIWLGISNVILAVLDYLRVVESNELTLSVVNLLTVLIQNRRNLITDRL